MTGWEPPDGYDCNEAIEGLHAEDHTERWDKQDATALFTRLARFFWIRL